MRIFISGIMQGSLPGVEVHGQDYRGAIREIILASHPEAEIIDPWELHPESPSYAAEKGRRTFLELIEEASRADIVVAYLSEASMGTAIEMWRAYEKGLPILTISPLAENWAVKFLSTQVFATLEEFETFVVEGGLEELRGPSS
ncbi:MAG: nucleoside 2-deoxyribosyltransferase [Anaerolineae bacterium]|nr:nucleoside 2-deoxyribosyltransferase [Anaerolineae bacterium]